MTYTTQELLNAAKTGDIVSVKKILDGNEVDINCKDISIQNIHAIQLQFFIVFNTLIIYGIQIEHLIGRR